MKRVGSGITHWTFFITYLVFKTALEVDQLQMDKSENRLR